MAKNPSTMETSDNNLSRVADDSGASISMAKFAPIHWKQFEKFVLFVGCSFARQKGDHRIYWREGLKRPVVFSMDEELRSDFFLR